VAYFQNNGNQETVRRKLFSHDEQEQDAVQGYSESEEYEDEYDDGFDELNETEEEELQDEEQILENRNRKLRFFSGIGDLTAVIAGSVVILVLLALLLNMVSFVITDVNRNFTLFQTRF